MLSTPLQVAESYVGFRSRALRTNDFGAKTGFNTQIWSGSFLQVIFQESAWDDVFFPQVHWSHTVHALEYVRLRNLTVKTPKPGDVVFLAYGTDGMSQPHVGIVADVQNWKDRGILQVIEGETAPNTSKGHSGIADGVWKRTRYAAEVLEFARMENWRRAPFRRNVTDIEVTDFKYLGRGKHVEIVQRALADVYGNRIRGVKKGMWDAQTSHAYAQWQRMTGNEPTGLPDKVSLFALAVESGRFNA